MNNVNNPLSNLKCTHSKMFGSFMSKNNQPFPLAPVERGEHAAQPSPSYGQDVRQNLYPSL